MNGLFHRILTQRYGMPEVSSSRGLVTNQWNVQDESKRCILYLGMNWEAQNDNFKSAYKELYGDAFGGYLLLNSIKIATLAGVEVYGLYTIEQLQERPEIFQAKTIDPDIHFFMDSANVWFYGHKNGYLYVYDGETEELDQLGLIEIEIEKLLIQWEEAINSVWS
jgi:hypothetical protein